MSACSAGRTIDYGIVPADGEEYDHLPLSAQPRLWIGVSASLMPVLTGRGDGKGKREAETGRGDGNGNGWLFIPCPFPISDFPFPMVLSARLQSALAKYDSDDNLGRLLDTVRDIARNSDPDLLMAAAIEYMDRPEIVIPVYEHVVAVRPRDARAIVTLANAYWLTGRGPDVVGELAARAMEADPGNRAGWHLWALSEADVRKRMERWRAVAERFPQDQLARAALADNAASVASTEHDPRALDLAVTTYEGLLSEASTPTQRRALESTLETLRSWKI